MVDSRIKEVFDRYVAKFDAIGNGNFGLRNGFLASDLEVLASNTYDGSLLFKSDRFAETYNCARTASEIAQELQKQGFSVKRKNIISDEGYQQHFVEVFDPDSQTWIQIDATPWYKQMGNIHPTGNDTPEQKVDRTRSAIMPNVGQFIATQQQKDGSFVDAYLAGGYFSLEQNLEQLHARMEAQIKGLPFQRSTNPHYKFILWARQGPTCDAKTTSHAQLRYNIVDSAKVELVALELGANAWLQNPRAALERLVEVGAADIKIEGTRDWYMNLANYCLGFEQTEGGNSFAYLELLKKRGDTTLETIQWLEDHLAVLANVAFRLGPYLNTPHGKILRMGQPCAREEVFSRTPIKEILLSHHLAVAKKFDLEKYFTLAE